MTKEEVQELVYAEATIDRISRYSTAYSLKHKTFVEIMDVRQHANGEFSIRARVANQPGSEIFGLRDLINYCY